MGILKVVATVLALSASPPVEEPGTKDTLSPPKEPSRDSGIVVIVASGVGTSVDIACKEAIRNAVEKAVGSAVSAETLIKNDRLITDSILTYSDGFVDGWERIGDVRKTTDGLFRVLIKARVQQTKLVQRLEATNVTVSAVAGNDLLAEAVSKYEREKDGEALILKLLEGFPGTILRAEVVGKPRIIKASDREAMLGVTVTCSVDLPKYADWIARTRPYLTKVASKTTRLPWVPSKFGRPLGKTPSLERWRLDDLNLPRDRRKSDKWGSLSIPKNEWLRCYEVTDRVDWLSDSRQKHHILAVATRYVGDSMTLYYFDSAAFETIIKAACFSLPLVSVAIKDERGNSLTGIGPELALTKEHEGVFLSASPIWIFNGEHLGFVFSEYIRKDWKPTEDAVRSLKEKQLFVSPYLQAERAGDTALITAFSREFELPIAMDQLKNVASVEVKIWSRNMFFERP